MNYKTPSPKMAAVITLILLALFAFSYVVPVLNVSWVRDGATFDQALQQNLLLLLVLAVGYYIGTTKSSDDKTETIKQQASTAAALATASTPPTDSTGTPIVKVDTTEPLKVKEVDIDLGKP